MIDLDAMPDKIKKMNRNRRIGIVAATVLGLLFSIMVMIPMFQIVDADEETSAATNILLIIEIPLGLLIAGGCFYSFFSHGLQTLKKAYGLLMRSPVWILHLMFFLFPFVLVYIYYAFAGWIYYIIDLIRFFTKKPLVYEKEAQAIIQKTEQNTNYDEQQRFTQDTMENIKKLKEMLDSGIITEDEFNKKKSELLEMI